MPQYPMALGRWALSRDALTVEFASFLSAVLSGMCVHTQIMLKQNLNDLTGVPNKLYLLARESLAGGHRGDGCPEASPL